jgi:uncharacterized Zn ribbon protein
MIDTVLTEPIICPKCSGEDVYLNSENKYCFCSECEYRWVHEEGDS